MKLSVLLFLGALAGGALVSLRTPGEALVRECDDDPFGLCPFGQTCVDRMCVPLCGPTRLDGTCVEHGAVCLDGQCGFPGPGSRRLGAVPSDAGFDI